MYRVAIFYFGAVALSALAIAAPVKSPPKETAQQRLSGIWELRADDGRTGALVLRPDGILFVVSATAANRLPDYKGHWYLLEEDGNRFVLEFGQERGGRDSYKVVVVLTCGDAFTLVETVKNRVSIREQHRFVRTFRTSNPP